MNITRNIFIVLLYSSMIGSLLAGLVIMIVSRKYRAYAWKMSLVEVGILMVALIATLVLTH